MDISKQLHDFCLGLEEFSELVDSSANLGLVATPNTELTEVQKNMIEVAQATSLSKHNVTDFIPVASVVSIESFSLDGVKKAIGDLVAKIVAAVKKVVSYILGLIKSADGKIDDAINKLKSYDDAFWDKLNNVLGKNTDKDTGGISEPEPLRAKIAIGVGDEQIKTVEALLTELKLYEVKILSSQFKLLDCDNELINDLFAAAGYFGKLNLKSGVDQINRAVDRHESVFKTLSVDNKHLGGLTLEQTLKNDNLAIDNAAHEAIVKIKATNISKTQFDRIELDRPKPNQIKNLVTTLESITKQISNKKDGFGSYSEKMIAEANKLKSAYDHMIIDENDEDQVMCLVVGRKLIGVIIWLLSRYAMAGATIINTCNQIIDEVLQYISDIRRQIRQ